ncbi:CCA tRNA nucleotidyltransferase [Rhizobium alvei]|uniref:CCA tRNA nucleotidyltransferase n=1 Tax=Rhizobium alvei TaxID=1132659 RepID=A0ABT8YKL1_9HYPH|nr:CCA tRNA nucleotidyltransferase [Rhizobium alvei]MDO6964249.1 CCA tRNA nucleotidyltransferase [Rhizobium alvei]
MTSVADEPWFADEALQKILAVLNGEGGEARIVGGAVRNALLGLPVSDMDIATTLEPEAVQARAEAAGIRCVPTGIKHGTVTLVLDGRPFEVTTLRTDVETDGRHAEVAFTKDWQADAARRDLTINALYADRYGVVHDYVGGLEDIRTATVRFIGDASERIAEDHLRILRFFRFFAHYGRGRPDAEGLKACARAKGKLKLLSAERVWSELKKLLSAREPGKALLWMRTTGVLTEILPESEKWGIDSIPALMRAEASFGWPIDPLLRLAAIVPPDAERLSAMSSRLKLANVEKDFFQTWARAKLIAEEATETALKQEIYHFGPVGIETRLKLALVSLSADPEPDVATLAKIAVRQKQLSIVQTWPMPTMPIRGADLIEAGYAPGPALGANLAKLEALWVASGFSATAAELIATLGDS